MHIIEKLRIRAIAISDVGVKVEATRDEYEKQVQQARGAKLALIAHSKNVQGLVEAAKKELSDDDDENNIVLLGAVVKHLDRAFQATVNSARHYESLELNNTGSLQALQQVITNIKKEQDLVMAKIDQIIAAASSEEAEPADRIAGTRPALSIAQQRKAEVQSEISDFDAPQEVAVPDIKPDVVQTPVPVQAVDLNAQAAAIKAIEAIE